MVGRRGTVAALAVPAALLGVAGGAGVAGCGGDDDTLAGVLREPPLEVGALSMPTVDGEEMSFTAPDGELNVVYFGYTSCPDICPTTMQDLSRALDELDDGERDRVNVAMATVDPERDTDDVLRGYLGSFFDDAVGLRQPDADELAATAEGFGVQFEIAPHDPGDTDYEVGHTATTFVVDDTGDVVVEWPFGLESDSMASDLRILLKAA